MSDECKRGKTQQIKLDTLLCARYEFIFKFIK